MPKFCPNCGEEISDKVKFCPKCGADIDSFSVKKDEKSIVEETKKEIKIEDTKIDNKKSDRNIAYPKWVYGVIIVAIIIVLLAVISMFSAFSAGMNQNIKSSPITTSVPTTVATSQMVITPTPTSVAPTTFITTQPTKTPSVGPLVTICSWQLDTLKQMGIHGSPYPLIHTYFDKYDPKRDPNYQVDYKTKYSQYWMNPTTGSVDPTIVRPLLSLTSRDTGTQNYYVETIFYDSNVKTIPTTNGTANNGYAWINVDPKQTVVAEVVAPESAACYEIKKVCTVTNAGYNCSFYDVVPNKY